MKSVLHYRKSGERTLVMLLCASAVVVGAFWSARVVYVRATERMTASTLSVPDVWPVGGMRIRFESPAVTSMAGIPALPRGGRHLLLVASDTCPATAVVLPLWRRLIRSLPFEEGDGIIVVSWGNETGRVLRAEAMNRGVNVRVYAGSDTRAWSATTGFMGTPVTAGLDEDERLRLLPHNPLNENDYDLLNQFFARAGA